MNCKPTSSIREETNYNQWIISLYGKFNSNFISSCVFSIYRFLVCSMWICIPPKNHQRLSNSQCVLHSNGMYTTGFDCDSFRLWFAVCLIRRFPGKIWNFAFICDFESRLSWSLRKLHCNSDWFIGLAHIISAQAKTNEYPNGGHTVENTQNSQKFARLHRNR